MAAAVGKVASLHLHPPKSGEPFVEATAIRLVAGKGIEGESRYFGRRTRRQLTLIEREQLQEHADALGIGTIEPGEARSQVETEGIDLQQFIGKRLQVGEAVVEIYAPRDPCWQMDKLAEGLKERMMNGKQGVLAKIIETGEVKVGDSVGPV